MITLDLFVSSCDSFNLFKYFMYVLIFIVYDAIFYIWKKISLDFHIAFKLLKYIILNCFKWVKMMRWNLKIIVRCWSNVIPNLMLTINILSSWNILKQCYTIKKKNYKFWKLEDIEWSNLKKSQVSVSTSGTDISKIDKNLSHSFACQAC